MEVPSQNIFSGSNVSYKDKIWHFMKEQRREGNMCDVLIKSNDQTFHAHRIVLAAVSPYFRALVLRYSNNSLNSGALKFDLYDFTSGSIKLLLNLIYEESCDDENVDVFDFLHLLDFIQLDSCYDAVLQAIRPYVTVNNCLQLFELAIMCNIYCISNCLSVFIGGNFFTVMNSDTWAILDIQTINKLLEFDAIKCLPPYLLSRASSKVHCSSSDIFCQSIPFGQQAINSNSYHCDLRQVDQSKTLNLMYSDEDHFFIHLNSKCIEYLSDFTDRQSEVFAHYFSINGQLYNMSWTSDGLLKLSRFCNCLRSYGCLWSKKIEDFSKFQDVFRDATGKFIYLIITLKADIFIMEINMETYRCEDNHHIPMDRCDAVDGSLICYNQSSSEILFFCWNSTLIYNIGKRTRSYLTQNMEDIFFLGDNIRILCHADYLYVICLLNNKIYIRKLGLADMSEKAVCSFQFNTQPCSLDVTVSDPRRSKICLYVFFDATPNGEEDDWHEGKWFCKILHYCVSHDTLEEICTTLAFDLIKLGRAIEVPAHLFY